MPYNSVTEQRYREGSGEKFLVDGRVRCQALSKAKMRKYREEMDDYITPKEDLWPECQCVKAAEPGAFACRWHGGATPKKTSKQPRSLMDVMPLDLADMMRTLMENPQYLNRREDIVLIQTRVWQLMQELQDVAGSDEAWGSVAEALIELRKGNETEALLLLEVALKDVDRTKEIWDEVRKNELLIKELTNTQVRTAKDLQQMATTEQVMATVMNLYELVVNWAEKYIDEPTKRSQALQELSLAVSRYANVSPATVSYQVESGRAGD